MTDDYKDDFYEYDGQLYDFATRWFRNDRGGYDLVAGQEVSTPSGVGVWLGVFTPNAKDYYFVVEIDGKHECMSAGNIGYRYKSRNMDGGGKRKRPA